MEINSKQNKKEIEVSDNNIAAWEQQIKDLQTNIKKAKEHKEEIIKVGREELDKEIQVGIRHVEQAQNLEKEIITLASNKFVFERCLGLSKSKYECMKVVIPF